MSIRKTAISQVVTGGKMLAARAAASSLVQSGGLPLLLILAVVAGVYAPSLSYWFWQDDVWYLPSLRGAQFFEFTRDAFDFRDTSEPVPLFLSHYRPLYLVDWLVHYRLFGLEPFGYHVTSVLLHLVNVTLVWLIAMRLSGRQAVAHIAALVFGLHPATTLSVAWISGMTDLETGFASLSALWLFMKFIDGGRRATYWYVASVLMFLAALLFHLKAAPILVPMVGYYLLNIKPAARDLLRPSSWGIFVPYAALVLAYLGVQLWVRQEYDYLGALYQIGWFNGHNFLAYLSMAVLPVQLEIRNPNIYADVSVHVPAMITGSLLLAGLCLWVLAKGGRRLTVELVALTWFLAAVLQLITFTIGAIGRDLYIAGPAWAILVGLVGVWCWDRVAGSGVLVARLALAAALIAAIGFASARTISYERGVGNESAQLEAFISGLRRTHPVLPEGSTVLAIRGPSFAGDQEDRMEVRRSLSFFYAVIIDPLVDIYYDGVRVRPVVGNEIPALEPGEYLYDFEEAAGVGRER